MKVFTCTHHYALFRSIYYLFCDRLGFELHAPNVEWCERVDGWGNMEHALKGMGGIKWDDFHKSVSFISEQEFIDTLPTYDLILITRVETEPYLFPLLDRIENDVPLVAFTGNENSPHDWSRIYNLIATDFQTYDLSPAHVHKIWTVQEIGRNYQTPQSIEGKNPKGISAFINNLPNHNRAFRWNCDKFEGTCPHCQSATPSLFQPVNMPALWDSLLDTMPDYKFVAWGANSEKYNGRLLSDWEMPSKYHEAALTWHFKTFEGYGHSLIQSIVCGTPVMIPKRFYNYRTARRFLIPSVTCFESDWSVSAMKEVIEHVTCDEETTIQYHEACRRAASGLFDWFHEAWRVSRWLEDVI